MFRTPNLTLIAFAFALCSGCGAGLVTVQTNTGPEPVAEPASGEPADVHLVDDHITIDQKIHFTPNSAEIADDSSELLDHIATFLGLHAEVATLHVIGHTDFVGTDSANQTLSDARAQSVVDALNERGVSTRMDARGAGENEPVCTEDTDECHEQNRRVEFLVEMTEE